MLDGAGYTFEELFKELSKGTDALKSGETAAEVMSTAREQVLPVGKPYTDRPKLGRIQDLVQGGGCRAQVSPGG